MAHIRIGKCGACKQTSRRDYTEKRDLRSGGGWMTTVSGRTVENNRFIRAGDDCECPRCGQYRWNSRKVDGFTTSTRCDARCEGARGHICECSCGGENHGKGFLICTDHTPLFSEARNV